MTYRPELDGLRGIAILVVMLFHSLYWFPHHVIDGGTLGVDLFFVLSGFLITTLLLDEERKTGGFDRGNFYMRRVLRLGPALVLTIALAGVIVHVVGNNGPNGYSFGRSALASAFFVGNVFQYWIGTLAHTWSLGLEEQYYLIWPVLLAFAIRRKVPTKKIVTGLLVAIAIVAASRSFIYHRYSSASPVWKAVHPWAQSDAILIGSLFAVLWAADGGALRRLFASWEFAAASVICAVAIYWRSAISDPVTYDLLLLANACFAVIVLHAVASSSSPISRALRLRPLPEIGRISYGLYLYHWPLFFLVQHGQHPAGSMLSAWAWSFVAAIVSYHAIERPVLSLKSRFASGRHPERAVVRKFPTGPAPRVRAA